jgi:hypothetical protein
MIMYKKCPDSIIFGENKSIIRIADGACIPPDPANTDYQTFKKEVLAGAELQDADGNVMTQEQATEFINTLPQ